ncbi:MAG: hypothetical protein EOO40_03605 [Deltaproteobacteria bacterium]|nr:MAG: hypothetical protein EOO40_03605 [Deltaproteobacteria bacterium]
MTRLTALSLRSTALTATSAVAENLTKMTRLQRLDLSYNEFYGQLSGLDTLQHLRELGLA